MSCTSTCKVGSRVAMNTLSFSSSCLGRRSFMNETSWRLGQSVGSSAKRRPTQLTNLQMTSSSSCYRTMTMSSSSSAHSLSRHHSREYASFVHSNLTSSSSSSTSILPTHASSPSPVADSWYLGDPAVPPLQAGAPGIANPADAVQAYRAARLSSAESLSSTKAGNPTVTLKITVSNAPSAAPVKVVFVTQSQAKAGLASVPIVADVIGSDATNKAILEAFVKTAKFEGGFKSTLLASVNNTTFLFVGTGDVVDGTSSSSAFLTLDKVRVLTHAAVAALKSAKAADSTWVLPSSSVPISLVDAVALGRGEGVKSAPKKPSAEGESKVSTPTVATPKQPATEADVVEAVSRLITTSNHVFDKYWKPEAAKEKNFSLTSAHIVVSGDASSLATVATNSQILGESVLLARELGNDRSAVVTPQYLEDIARRLVEANPEVMKIRVLKKAELLANGFNLITAVGQAAPEEPRIVAIEYDNSGDANAEWLGYVGKGITFDTGGLNLKPTGFMEEMHMDMCGSAAVISTMRYLGVARPKTKVVGILAIAENSIDANSYKPYAIIDTYVGSVQVGNTDAEGRLALADALTFVQNEYKVNKVVDIATLTGACVVALNEYASGQFSNDSDFADGIRASGQKHYERIWPLPIFPETIEEMKGDQSDHSSTGKGRMGGASSAAAFLEKYIQANVSWCHLDVAGPAMFSAPRGYLPKGATGFGVQTLVEYAVSKKE